MSMYLVGASAKEITPPADLINAGRIFLWGFASRNSFSTGIRDPIWARSLAIRDAEGTWVVLVSLDLVALDPQFTTTVRSRLAESRGIPPQAIAINVSHTHSAPVTVAIPTWSPGFDRPDPEYLAFLEHQVVASIEQAITNSKPAILEFARGSTNIGANRHFGKGAAYDQTLDVIQASDEDGNCIAVAFFHGCHPVFLRGPDISSDYPGTARDVIEEAVGGVAIFFQGYGGTINPNLVAGLAGAVDEAGQTLGRDVLILLNGPMDELEGPVEALRTAVDIPLQPLDPQALERAKTEGDFNLKRWASFIASQGDDVPDSLPVELQGIRVGVSPNDWRLVACSHEVVAEFADPIRAIWPYQRVSLMGYSNGQMSYLPTSAVLANPPCTFPFCANYEGGMAFTWYGHRAPVTPEVDDLVIDGNIKLFDPRWELIGHAQEVVAMTALNGKLFAATQAGQLWWRKPIGEDIVWNHMGHAEDVVGMTALNGMLFAATAEGKLWRRIPYGFDLPWEHIGHAQEVVAMTALNGKLFAASRAGQLWWRDPLGYDVAWERIGPAQEVVGMTAAGGKLICATVQDGLWWRDPVGTNVPWHRFGTAENVVGMAALNGKLFAATQEGQLWWRDL